jgi:hypothetical protein
MYEPLVFSLSSVHHFTSSVIYPQYINISNAFPLVILLTHYNNAECAAGHYNESGDCQQECGECRDGRTSCDKHTGHCSACQPGVIPPLCHQSKTFEFEF